MNETLVPTQTLLFIRTYILLLLLFNVHFIVEFLYRAARCLFKGGWVMNSLYELCITLTQILFLLLFQPPSFTNTFTLYILFQLYLLWIKFHGVCAVNFLFSKSFQRSLNILWYSIRCIFTWFFDWYHCWWCYSMIVVVMKGWWWVENVFVLNISFLFFVRTKGTENIKYYYYILLWDWQYFFFFIYFL